MTANEFLERLEQDGLVEQAVITALRRKVTRPGKELSAQRIGKYLVSKGYVQATTVSEILGESNGGNGLRELSVDDLVEDASGAGAVDEAPSDSGSSTSRRSKQLSTSSRSKRKNDEAELAMLSAADVVEEEEEEIVDLAAAPDMGGVNDLADLDELVDADPLGMQGDGLDPDDEKKPKQSKKEFAGKYVVENQWDSKWIFIGPTIVILLVMLTLFLYFVLSRGNSQELFEAIQDSYRSQRYGEAIERADDFLKKHSSDDNASLVACWRGMARIRMPVESRDWDGSLEQLQAILPEIKEEEAFAEVREDVGVVILAVGQGFSKRAEAAREVDRQQALVDQTEAVMEFTKDPEYAPASWKRKPVNASKMREINEAVARVKRAIAMEERLVVVLAEIGDLIDAGETEAAYDARKSLLRAYPSLETEPRLQEAVTEITEKERTLVRVGDLDLATSSEDPTTVASGVHVLATVTGNAMAELDGEVVPLMVNGSVFALNAGTGEVLWRRHVGIGNEFQPQWIDRANDNDLLLVDSRSMEILRVNSRTGALVWRMAIGESFAEPIISNQRAYLATRSGKLLEIDLATGESARQSQIPQPLFAGPSSDAKSKFLYQPGSHSNIYVLSASSLECTSVFYAGHSAGSIEVPPVMASGYLFVAENAPGGVAGGDYCEIRVFEPTAGGIEDTGIAIRLGGRVVSPMLLYQRRVLVITTQGDIALLDIDVTSEERPVTAIAEFQLESKPELMNYYAADQGQLFVADQGITRFEIQAQRGKLDRQTATNSGDTFVGPIFPYGEVVIHTRRRRGSTLISITAATVEENDLVWRTDLAAPTAGPPIVNEDGTEVMAVTAQGDQFILTPDKLDGFTSDRYTRRASTTLQDLVFHDLIDFGDGKAVAFGPGQLTRQVADGPEISRVQMLSIDPSQTALPSRLITLETPYDKLATAPVRFGSGVLVPSMLGQVFYLNAQDGRPLTVPFLPAVEPGAEIVWRQPTIVSDSQFVVADARGILYLVEYQPGSPGTLLKAAELRHEQKILSDLTFANGYVFAVSQAPGGQMLECFRTQPLESAGGIELGGLVVTGPFAAGDAIFAVLDDGSLHCFSANESIDDRWEVPLNGSTIVGAPQSYGSDLLVTTNRGFIAIVDPSDGSVKWQTDVGEPIAYPSVVMDGKLLVGTLDGSLVVVPTSP